MADAKEESKTADAKGAHKSSGAKMSGLEKKLNEMLVTNSPVQLPDEAKEWIVKYGPWGLVIVLILSVPALISLLNIVGILSGSTLAAYTVRSTSFLWLGIAVQLVGLALIGISIPGLLNRQLSAWRLVFWADLIYLGSSFISALSVSDYIGNLFLTLVFAGIGFWFLFQIRNKYS